MPESELAYVQDDELWEEEAKKFSPGLIPYLLAEKIAILCQYRLYSRTLDTI